MTPEEAQKTIDQLPPESLIARDLMAQLKDAADGDGQVQDEVAIAALITAIIRLERAIHLVAAGRG